MIAQVVARISFPNINPVALRNFAIKHGFESGEMFQAYEKLDYPGVNGICVLIPSNRSANDSFVFHQLRVIVSLHDLNMMDAIEELTGEKPSFEILND